MASRKSISLGQVVKSKMGRDLDMLYLVIGIQGNSALVANGKERKVLNPKKKNIRHLEMHKRICQFVLEKLGQKQLPRDEQIRGFLNSYKPDQL